MPINDTRTLINLHVYKGTWRRDFETAEYPSPQSADTGAFACPTIHGYVYPSTVDPSATPSITIIGQTFVVGASHFWDFSAGSIRSTRPVQTVPGQPAVFKNINQRCFGGDGLAEAIIMDDRTPAIHSQPNQKLGIDAPQQQLPLNGGTGFQPFGTGYATQNSKFVNSPNPNNLISTIKTTDTPVTVTHINAGLAFGISASGTPPTGAVTVAGKSSNSATFTANGTISITTGTSLVTLSGSTWPASGEYCGLAINFNGYSFVVAETNNSSNSWTIDGVSIGLTNVQLLILGVYTGPTLTNVPYTITGAQFKLTNASSALAQTGAMPLGYGQSTNSNLVQVLVFATQANGFYRNLGNISLGPAGGGTQNTVTDTFALGGNPIVLSPTGPWTSSDIGSTIVIDMQGTAPMHITTIGSLTAPGQINLTTSPGGVATVSPTRSWWGTDYASCTDATITVPGAGATLTSASTPFTANDAGKTIMIEKAAAGGVIAQYTTITSFVNTSTVTVANAGAAVAGVVAAWRGVTGNAHPGPTYAYAWYDPETGHVSNISPLTTIPRPTIQGSFPDFANITPVFNIDPGQIAYPSGYNYLTPTGDAVRFSHLIFFRTLSTPGASTLYPIGSLQPFIGKVHPGLPSTRGSWNPGPLNGWDGLPNNWAIPGAVAGQQWYDFSSDTDLLLAGGFRAPQFTNSKPMVLLRGGITQPGYPSQIAYWDRRCWIVNTQEPDKIAFSCDDAQCPLGVPEESYPATNFLRLPAEDGQVQGMRTVGDLLLITTNRFAYIVAGNNESNYRLMKVSASMPGVGTFQMSEFPTNTGAEGEPATLFFVGRDRILYQWMLGGTLTPISQAVQNYFDTVINSASVGTYRGSRVHCVSAWGRRLVVFSPSSGSLLQVYDIDNKIWSSMFISDGTGAPSAAPISMATVYGGNVPVNEIYAVAKPSLSTVVVRSWLRDDQPTTLSPGSFLDTFPIQFDDKKTRKQICMVNIHATAGTWNLVTTVNESTTMTTTVPFAAYPDPVDSIYGPVPSPVDGATVQDSVVMTAQFNTDATPIVGYRFVFSLNRLDTTPGQVFAIDIGYKELEDPGEGDT
jgi:hypothetical protein